MVAYSSINTAAAAAAAAMNASRVCYACRCDAWVCARLVVSRGNIRAVRHAWEAGFRTCIQVPF